MTACQDTTEFAILVPIGPAELEIDRAKDLYESILAYESNSIVWFVLIDDCLKSRSLPKHFSETGNFRVVALMNPRMGQGSGWSGGLSAGVIEGLRWIQQNTAAAFVVRLDTDSLVISSFSAAVADAFSRMPSAGLIGSHTRSPYKQREDPSVRPHAWLQKKLLRTFAFWIRRRPWKSFQVAWWGRWRRIRDVLRLAMENGYCLGDFVMGGGYALRRETMDRMAELGLLDDPLFWIDVPISEDVAVSVFTKAAGWNFADLNADGEPFGVKYAGLADSPENLVKRGFSIIHSIKNDSRWSENELREYFRARRDQQLQESTTSTEEKS